MVGSEAPPRPSRLSQLSAHWSMRAIGRVMAIAGALLAAAVVSTLTDRPRPRLRGAGRARGLAPHRAAGAHRPAVGIHLLRGRVVLEDLRIEGLQPEDRPFFTAKRLSLSLDWSKALARRPSSS